MNVLVVGATGRNGMAVVKQLQDQGHHVVATGHNPAKLANIPSVERVVIDLVNEDVSTLVKKLPQNIDALIFTAGASQARPQDAVWIDLDGAVKMMDVARQLDIPQFIMESAAGAGSRSTFDVYDIPLYYVTKYYAERILKSSGLTYTIVRPAILTDQAPTRTASLANNVPQISRTDVAEVLVDALMNDNFKNKAFDLFAGTTPLQLLEPK
ncbi:NAD(P)H-binding protein [Furfurilactobacillus curtus]|uniref:Sugar epimerase YhfK n=1 Tax=Furfurilactobacillus curtus TaxID=1746200 RepID=A0ABQ5JKV9_9LACO